MKQYDVTLDLGVKAYEIYFVGTADEVKCLYKHIVKAWNKGVCGIFPRYDEFPKFNSNKMMYGLHIDYKKTVTVVNSDTMLAVLTGYDWSVVDVQEVC